MTIKTEPDGKRWTTHAPGANLDYSVDWSTWLTAGETITDSDWVATTGIALTNDAVVSNNTVATAFAAGGVDGQNYVLTNTITTSAGRVDSRTITLRCRVR